MKLINKLLVLVFLIFLAIIFIETYYLFAGSKKGTITTKSLLKDGGEISEESVVVYKNLVKNRIITSSVNKTRYEGRVLAIRNETKSGSSNKTAVIVKRLTLQNETKTAENDFFFLEKALNKVKVSSIKNNQKKTINFSDLKAGDTLTMMFTIENIYDVTDPRYLIECTIDRIEK